MPQLTPISSVKKDPASLASGGLQTVLKNNKPVFLALPYDADLVSQIEDLIEEAALLKNTKLLASLPAARKMKKYSAAEARKKLGL